MNMLDFKKVNCKSNLQAHQGLHSCIASGDNPDIPAPVSQIQESRSVEDPGMFGSKMSVLAFISALKRGLNLFNVHLSALSWTIAV